MRHLASNHSLTDGLLNTRFTKEQVAFIEALKLPRQLEVSVATKNDTLYVETHEERWVIRRLGSEIIYNFNVDDVHLNKLLKFIMVRYIQHHAAPMSSSRFSSLKSEFKTLDMISDELIIRRLEVLAEQNNSSRYFPLKSSTKTLFRIAFPGFVVA